MRIVQNYEVRFMLSNVFRLLLIFVLRLTLRYRLKQTHQHWDPILCCCGCIKHVHYPWFEWCGCLYFTYCTWAGFNGGEAWEEKLCMCYCSRAIQHILWYMHTSLMSYTRVSCKISQVTHMWVSSLNWAVCICFAQITQPFFSLLL